MKMGSGVFFSLLKPETLFFFFFVLYFFGRNTIRGHQIVMMRMHRIDCTNQYRILLNNHMEVKIDE